MNVKDAWQEKIYAAQARQAAGNLNRAFMRSLELQRALRRAARIRLGMAAFAALLAWSFAGMRWLG